MQLSSLLAAVAMFASLAMGNEKCTCKKEEGKHTDIDKSIKCCERAKLLHKHDVWSAVDFACRGSKINQDSFFQCCGDYSLNGICIGMD
ncbi:hypothetical protein O9K51_07418 [Purpureocillium lavendulum]|uniref:Uncharacterized protein n=1 Tax=Purpureocillium lavendulum TaxID=1247861 RepID=A0AB34FL05_9HYPO|nr:hypothetical protein O9K51_07418 [Purpureocillium lavendulum]